MEVAEPVGSDVFVNLRAGTHAVVARFGPDTLPSVGETLRLAVQPQSLHFFDVDTGLRRDIPG